MLVVKLIIHPMISDPNANPYRLKLHPSITASCLNIVITLFRQEDKTPKLNAWKESEYRSTGEPENRREWFENLLFVGENFLSLFKSVSIEFVRLSGWNIRTLFLRAMRSFLEAR